MAEIRTGKKVDAATMDRSKMGATQVQPPQARGEVEGQYAYVGLVSCPCHGHVTWAEMDSDSYEWFTCGVCGCAFSA